MSHLPVCLRLKTSFSIVSFTKEAHRDILFFSEEPQEQLECEELWKLGMHGTFLAGLSKIDENRRTHRLGLAGVDTVGSIVAISTSFSSACSGSLISTSSFFSVGSSGSAGDSSSTMLTFLREISSKRSHSEKLLFEQNSLIKCKQVGPCSPNVTNKEPEKVNYANQVHTLPRNNRYWKNWCKHRHAMTHTFTEQLLCSERTKLCVILGNIPFGAPGFSSAITDKFEIVLKIWHFTVIKTNKHPFRVTSQSEKQSCELTK